jgi:hypothetical protein
MDDWTLPEVVAGQPRERNRLVMATKAADSAFDPAGCSEY